MARTTGLQAVSGGARGVARSGGRHGLAVATHRRPATVPEKGREAMVGPAAHIPADGAERSGAVDEGDGDGDGLHGVARSTATAWTTATAS